MQYQYDPKSHIAQEFIHHGEILDTLAYAREHANDRALVEELLKRAEDCKGPVPELSILGRNACIEQLFYTGGHGVIKIGLISCAGIELLFYPGV